MSAHLHPCPTCGAPRVIGPDTSLGPIPDILAEARRQIAQDLAGCPEDCWRLIARLFTAPAPRRARALAPELGVHPSTLISRFDRAGLPSPSTYMRWVVVLEAAWRLENRTHSISRVAFDLDLIPQNFNRKVRQLTGHTPAVYFATHDGLAVLRHIRETLVLPYVSALQGFHPLAALTAREWKAARERRAVA